MNITNCKIQSMAKFIFGHTSMGPGSIFTIVLLCNSPMISAIVIVRRTDHVIVYYSILQLARDSITGMLQHEGEG